MTYAPVEGAAVIPDSGGGPIHCVGFNADASCFAVGTPDGFLVYSTEPQLTLLCERTVPGGVAGVSLYNQSSVVGLVRAAARNEIILWDDHARPKRVDEVLRFAISHDYGVVTSTPIATDARCPLDEANSEVHNDVGAVVATLSLPTAVMALRVHPRVIVAADRLRVLVFDANLQLAAQYSAHNLNPHSLCLCAADCSRTGTVPIAFNGDATGSVRLLDYTPIVDGSAATRLASAAEGAGRLLTATPHSKAVGNLAMCYDGSKVVSASVSGTALKLIDFSSGGILRQLNRGATPNKLLSLGFNANASILAAVSETGTVHIFSLHATDGVRAKNPRSLMHRMAETVRSAVEAAGAPTGGKIVGDAMSYAQGDFAFATFSLGAYAEEDVRRLYGPATLAVLRPGVHRGHATMLVVQAEWGKLIRVAVNVTADASASAAENCSIVDTASFPPYEL